MDYSDRIGLHSSIDLDFCVAAGREPEDTAQAIQDSEGKV